MIPKSSWKRFKKESAGDAISIKDVKFPPEYSLQKHGITQSLLMSFMKCRREFLLKVNCWSLTAKRTTFANGSITHDILDKVYSYYMKNKKIPSTKIVKDWCNSYDKDHPDWLPEDKQDLAPLYKIIAFTICTEYIRFYRKKDFIPNRITGAEVEFCVVWKGFKLRGKRDLRFQMQPGVNWQMETKTMARIEPDAIREMLTFNFQNLFYVHCEEVEFGEPVHGVLYNVIRNPGTKLHAGESIIQYANRLRREIRKNQSYYFLRFQQPYTDEDKKQFRKELLYKLREVDALLKHRLYPWKNEKNCVSRFKCSYLPACSCGKLIGYGQYKRLMSELEEQ